MLVIFRQKVKKVLDKKAQFVEEIDFLGRKGVGVILFIILKERSTKSPPSPRLHQTTFPPIPKSRFFPSSRTLLSSVFQGKKPEKY